MSNSWLAHHGIMGQKWGRRRFQNPDGTLTEEGKKRYYAKVHKEYDKALQSMNKDLFSSKANTDRYIKANNKVSYYLNKGGIDKYNSDYDKKLRARGIDPDKHDFEYDKEYNEGFHEMVDELIGKEFFKMQVNEVHNHESYKRVQKLLEEYGEESLTDDLREFLEGVKHNEEWLKENGL